VFFKMGFAGGDHFNSGELEAALFEAGDNVADEASLGGIC
jgi:hypothetical protein